MRLGLRGLVVVLSASMAVACFGVAEGGGHCLNPQPDLPCNHSTGDNGASAGGPSAGSGPILLPSAGAGQSAGAGSINVGSGGAPGSDPGEPSAAAGADSEAAGGADSDGAAGEGPGSAGAGGEAGSIGGSDEAGAGAHEIVH